MQTLKGALAEFDDEVGLRLAAQARVRELEARVVELEAVRPAKAAAVRVEPPPEAPVVGEGLSKGQVVRIVLG